LSAHKQGPWNEQRRYDRGTMTFIYQEIVILHLGACETNLYKIEALVFASCTGEHSKSVPGCILHHFQAFCALINSLRVRRVMEK